MTRPQRLLTIAGALFAIGTTAPQVPAAEVLGTARQPIIAGAVVTQATQRDLALVTVTSPAGACSGTVINRYWVLTADHCVSTDGRIGGPVPVIPRIWVSAVWSTGGNRPATLVHRFVFRTGLDVALIHLGETNFGQTPLRLFHFSPIDSEMRVRAYGQGASAYAHAGPPRQPVSGDGLYRFADLKVTSVAGGSYRLAPDDGGRILAAGDSGGPDYTLDGNGSHAKIAGVHSVCEGESLAGAPDGAKWMTQVTRCTSSGVWPIYEELIELTRREKAEFCQAYSHEAVMANSIAVGLRNCGVGDLRFNATRVDHVRWCMSMTIGNGSASARETATAHSLARVRVIEECEFSQGLRPAALGSQPYVRGAPRVPGIADPGYTVNLPGPRPPSLDPLPSPDTCKTGFVWREARSSDHVCVSRGARTRTRQENKLARVRYDPFIKACLQGFVWREAFAGDGVCVHPDTRDTVREENQLARSRRVGN